MAPKTQPNRAQRRVAARNRATGNATLRISVGDESWLLSRDTMYDEITPADAAQVRRLTGMSLRLLVRAALSDPDLDAGAALIFLARRATGDTVDFEEVFKSLDYSTVIQVEVVDDETAAAADPEGEQGPEA
jgi:hypothetical protein